MKFLQGAMLVWACNNLLNFRRINFGKIVLEMRSIISYITGVLAGLLEIASHTTDAICGLQAPINLMELRSFLRLCKVF